MITSYLLITAIAFNTMGVLLNISGHSIAAAICIAVGYGLLFLWTWDHERELKANKEARKDHTHRLMSLEYNVLDRVAPAIEELKEELERTCRVMGDSIRRENREACEHIRLELGEKLTDWEQRHE